MMSKFEMALLTVTVVGTLVAWPALQQASFVRPTDGAFVTFWRLLVKYP